MKQIIVTLLAFLSFQLLSQAQVSWQMITPSVVGDNHLIYTMSAPTKDVVWATTIDWPDLFHNYATQKIIRTVNGGSTWTSFTFTTDSTDSPSSIFALDDKICYVCSVNGDYVSSIYRTLDGGATWEKMSIQHPAGFFNTLYFWDKMNGIALGDPDFDEHEQGKYLIYTTRDGGDTWVKSENAPAAIGGFSEYSFVNAKGIIGANTIFFTSNNPFNRIFKSDDRGLNWREIVNPYTGDTTSTGNFVAMAFSDDRNGLLPFQYNLNYPNQFGGELPALRTTDGGETWTKIVGTNSATRTEKGSISAVPGADSAYVIGHFNQGSSVTTNFGNAYTFNDFGGVGLKMFSPTEGWMSQFTLGGTHGRIGKFTGNLSPSNMRNVTFQVDMTGQTVSSNGVYVTGDYWSWKPNALKMNHLGNNIYEAKVQMPRGTALRYKFMNGGNWGQNEQVPEGCGSHNSQGGMDRTLTIGQWDMHVPLVAFSSCMETKGVSKPLGESRWCSRGTMACEYFEGYGINTKIGLQSTRWKSVNSYKGNGTEGGSDDAEVVSFWNGFTNYSGGRALRIHEGNDVMWLLGNQTSGNWDITMRLYVPTNFEAHLAAISNENNPNTRLFDYVLNTNKTAWSGDTYKTYAQNEWIAVKINVNLTMHTWSIAVNGKTVHSASSNDLTQLGALEFYAPTAFSEYFIDELEVKRVETTLPNPIRSSEFVLSPNPAQQKCLLQYDLPKMTDVTLSLTDINGRTVWSKVVENTRAGSETIDINHMTSGVYFVKILPIGEAGQVQRLVISR